ncbi:MAG: hypothetical protein K0S39_656 [Paenibacillus sp.]|jgi:hypothetical protein|nr:hypothetical protein [Paenibacillus sp.]
MFGNGKQFLLVLIVMLVLVQVIPFAGVGYAADGSVQQEPVYSDQELFVSGTEGYNTFRIPTILATKSGKLLAFAEGRKKSPSDTGDIDLVLKRSFDGGRTWQPLQVVCDDGPDTCGNPTAVEDEDTGRIWLFMTRNYGDDTIEEINNGTSRGVRTIWSTYSDDEGAGWAEAVNRFNEVQQPNTRWDATGPAIGIQLRLGVNKGRLVIPAIGRNIQSDDHGRTWYESGYLPAGTNEATVVELTDGTLMRNDRLSKNQELRRRAVSTSSDQGATWSPIHYAPELIDPICEASIVRYMPSDNGTGNRVLLFANPADENRRGNMTVRISYDDGASWTGSKTVFRGPAAYSSLTVMPNGTIAMLFEGGAYNAYDTIRFATFNFEWLLTAEPDLEDLTVSEGALSPVFRGDIGEYRLKVFAGTDRVTFTPISSNGNTVIKINGETAASGTPKTVSLNGLDTVTVEARLEQRVRLYTIHLDRTRLEPELLLHWDFDQANADGVADLTGKGHTGLLHNDAVLRPGLSGNALYLNGKRANMEITNEEDLHSGTGDFSFSVWVKPEALVQQRHIVYWYGQAGKGLPQWWLALEKNGTVRMNMAGLPSGLEVSSVTPPGLVKAGQWSHLAAVREGSVTKVYVNGELGSTSTKFDSSLMDVTNRNVPPLVGFDKGAVANRDFLGYLDDLQIYKNALNAAEIRKMYWNGDKIKPVTQSSVNPAAPNGSNGWYTADVSVTLSVYDDFSGVTGTVYRLNGGPWTPYMGTFDIATEGINVLEYRSTDQAGNVEDTQSLTLRIDKTAPKLKVAADRTTIWPPDHQWIPIHMHTDSTDDSSGISSVVLTSITNSELEDGDWKKDRSDYVSEAEFGTADKDFLLKAERNGNGVGRKYTIVYTATDRAGNTAAGTAIVSVNHDQSK